ncbi:MAG: NUDIX domain-containing protein [Bdellovibrionales bacterium]|nr:NUDIX domain-containing protein [Bdellovibrionales bacterium]
MILNNLPQIGVGVIIIRDNKVLLGMRAGAHGENTWQFPGGHLNKFETVEDCAFREAKEETGLEIDILSKGPYTDDHFLENDKHYTTLFVLAISKTGEPKVMEPDKCKIWAWYEWNDLPKPLFLPILNLLKSGFNPFNTLKN